VAARAWQLLIMLIADHAHCCGRTCLALADHAHCWRRRSFRCLSSCCLRDAEWECSSSTSRQPLIRIKCAIGKWSPNVCSTWHKSKAPQGEKARTHAMLLHQYLMF